MFVSRMFCWIFSWEYITADWAFGVMVLCFCCRYLEEPSILRDGFRLRQPIFSASFLLAREVDPQPESTLKEDWFLRVPDFRRV